MKTKDWTGNKLAPFACNGASNHSSEERAVDDYYATDPQCVRDLLEHEDFNIHIWEPAVGGGHIAYVLKENGHEVIASDIVDRGYKGVMTYLDFLDEDFWFSNLESPIAYDIITNPPYKYAKQFVQRALDLIPTGHKVAMFLKLTFLEGQDRRQLFDVAPPKTVYVYSKRQKCAKNGDFSDTKSSAVAYAWFVWEKDFIGPTQIKWI